MGTIIDDTTLATIEAEVAGDGVWIEPSFAKAHDLTTADERQIEQTVAASTKDLKVVLVDIDYADARFTGSSANLAAWVHDDLGTPMTWLGVDQVASSGASVQLSLDTYGNQVDTSYITNVVAHDSPEDVVAQVLQASTLLENGKGEKLWQAVPREERYPWTADERDGSGGSPMVFLGVLTVLLVVVAGVVLLARRSRRRAARGFQLSEGVLRTVKAAEDKARRRAAEQEVLALGETIGAAPDAPSASAAGNRAWQLALDHYAAARRVLDSDPGPADVVGALVLARRGESARVAVTRTAEVSDWQPPQTCWFNPLHPSAVGEVTWDWGRRRVQVPACPACTASTERGEEPDDILDFVSGDESEHYFNLDLGAWSATGYGALDPDLLAALRTSVRSRTGRLRRR